MNNPTPKNKQLIYDVGMHQGQDTEYYLRRGYKVIAFEANPDNIEVCKSKFASEIKEGRLIIVEGAIVDHSSELNGSKTVTFYRNADTSFWGSTNKDWAARNEVMNTTNEIMKVKAVNFVECLEQHGIPFYLKADIVGDETLCIKALLEFKNRPDYISIRSEKVIFDKLKQEFRLFEELGYNRFKAVQQDVHDWKFEYKSPEGATIQHSFGEGASGPFGEDTEGKWKSKEETLKDYRNIFRLYRLFGDYSFLMQIKNGKKMVSQFERIVRRPLPGWYDTHAKHSSVN